MVIQGVSYPSDFEAKKEIIAVAAKLEAKGYAVAGDGSLSVRVGPNAIWITVEGADKSALTQDQLVRIDLQGKQMATNRPKPLGQDLDYHLKIYRENDQVQSVIHAYPICTIALSEKGVGIEPAGFTPAVRKLGRIQLITTTETQKVAEEIALICKTDRGVILKNDGCMMWGRKSVDSFSMIQALDYYCKANRCACKGGQGCGSESQHLQNLSYSCNHDCDSCGKSGSCAESTATLSRTVNLVEPIAKPVPTVANINSNVNSTVLPQGMTGLIKPGQSLPKLAPESKTVVVKSNIPKVSNAAQTTAQPSVSQETLVVNVPKSVVMAEVVRRTLGN